MTVQVKGFRVRFVGRSFEGITDLGGAVAAVAAAEEENRVCAKCARCEEKKCFRLARLAAVDWFWCKSIRYGIEKQPSV